MSVSFKYVIALGAAALMVLFVARAASEPLAAPAAGIYTLSVHNQTHHPLHVHMDGESLGVVGRLEYQMFAIPAHLARKPSVMLTAHNPFGDTWTLRVMGRHEHFHWDIHAK
ncbi:MAG: hypothetical protein FJ303_22070 [Planctomycetes bacterium]|nr:hypothetical protein [Planctomycetota bacterium]